MKKTEKTRVHAAFVCQHLAADGVNLGFNPGVHRDEPERPWPYAWCDACEAVLAEQGEWTDRFWEHADLHLVDSEHYQRARRRNQS